MDSTVARQRLQEMLADLERSSQTLEAEGAGTGSELSSADQHPADAATDLQDADRQGAVLDTLSDQRAQVEAALARLEDGSYGTCVACGKQLPEERLEARPEAARCIECQTREEEER